MKRILVMRHAKSSWDDASIDDHERPLNARGKHDAPRMGQVLLDAGLVPDVIVSSTAVRARKTAKKVARAMGIEDRVELTGDLYMAGVDGFVEVLRARKPAENCVMLVSHNPGSEYLIAALTGELTPMSTAAVAVLECDIADWADFESDAPARLVAVYRPKEIGGSESE